jgi:prolyl-tRNA synthetase
MRYSELFGRTAREAPKDARTISHRLLHQGGFIRQIAAGRYAFLPLGFRVWEKIARIIDEEMRKIGSQRVTTPTLHPIEFWQATNRDQAFGEEMLIVEDHHGATFAVGATAEGLMVEMVKSFKPSYRDLPVVIHQFVQKFRDEKRPRGGLLRVREFMMKDAYSFHASEENLLNWYRKFHRAYLAVAARLELDVVPVLAHSGAIGGDYGHEFMVLSDVGEDTIFVCDHGDYAANIEKAESVFEKPPAEEKRKPLKKVLGKGIIGVAALAKFLKIPPTQTTKMLLYQADDRLVAACIRGDYEINEAKLSARLGCAHLELASAATVEEKTGAKVGYAGPINLPEDIEIVWDLTTAGRVNFEAGANRTGYHYVNVNFGRDLPEPAEFADIRLVKEGEVCPRCREGKLVGKRAIEFGHIFKQDHFYTGPMKGNFVDRDGEERPMWMGAYGIGIGRAMATIVEVHHDERGIVWPESVAPFQAHLVVLASEDSGLKAFADDCYRKLIDNDLEILYDDRGGVSAGVKFSDADLIGCPVRLVVSEKTLKEKKVEWKKRDEDKAKKISLQEAVQSLQKRKGVG